MACRIALQLADHSKISLRLNGTHHCMQGYRLEDSYVKRRRCVQETVRFSPDDHKMSRGCGRCGSLDSCWQEQQSCSVVPFNLCTTSLYKLVHLDLTLTHSTIIPAATLIAKEVSKLSVMLPTGAICIVVAPLADPLDVAAPEAPLVGAVTPRAIVGDGTLCGKVVGTFDTSTLR